jgi:hypothetical protein
MQPAAQADGKSQEREADMFGHYVKIAIRNFARHRMYSFINVGGGRSPTRACPDESDRSANI